MVRTTLSPEKKKFVKTILKTYQTIMIFIEVELTKMLGDLKNESGRAASNLETVENRREVLIELDVDDGTDDSHDASLRSTDCLSTSLKKMD